MSIVAHTPGPWRVPLDEPYEPRIPVYFLEDAAGHQLMLLRRLSEVGPEQHAANARLIAAAPEMLAILEALYVDLVDYSKRLSGAYDTGAIALSSCADQVAAVIRTAKDGAS